MDWIQNAIFAQGAKRMSARELFGRITFINHEIEEQLTHSQERVWQNYIFITERWEAQRQRMH